MLQRVLFIVIAGALLLGLLIYSQRQTGPLKISGFVEADEIRVGSRVGGRVRQVLVEEGTDVAIGDKLVELEPFNLAERRAQAVAELAERNAEYERLKAGYRVEEQLQAAAKVDQLAAELDKLKHTPRPEELEAARQEVEQAKAQYELSKLDHARIEQLYEQKAIAQDRFDRSASELRVTQATFEVRSQQLGLLERQPWPEDVAAATARLKEAQEASNMVHNGYRPEDVNRAKAAAEAAQAALAIIDREIEELTVKSTVNGVVEAIDLQPGDIVSASAPAVALLDKSRMWVRAYLPENRLDVQNGQQVWVTVDSFPDVMFSGHISFISREGEFTPRNIQTPEERSKQVFRIKVMLDEGLDKLRPGMAADVWFSKP
jgi:multidrug resistance efflux pump